LVKLAESQDVNEGLILATILFFVSLIVIMLHGWQIIMCCITVLYPALHSIRAIITPDNTDDKEWLTYWMIYGVITFGETFLGFFLSMIPYYDYARLCFFAWLLLPQFRGSAHMYDLFLKDILANHKETI
jgi:receptor expression-enhancing protein 5/6